MNRLTDGNIDFINDQPMFFVATAAPEGRVNMSPKGMDTLRVLTPNRIVWLNLTGSGNETAAHVAVNGRMTLMWMSVADQPLILRAYGTASVIHPRDDGWPDLAAHFDAMGGSRQIFDLAIEHVSSSCGSGVPVMSLEQRRGETALEPFYAEMSSDDLHDYWSRKNTESIDGLPTRIFSD